MVPKLIDPVRHLYSASGPVSKVMEKSVDGRDACVGFELMQHDPSIFILTQKPKGKLWCLVDSISVDLEAVGGKDDLLSQVYASACMMGSSLSKKFDEEVAKRASWPAELHRDEAGVEYGQFLGDVLITLMKALPPEELAQLSKNRMNRLMNYGNRFAYTINTPATDHQTEDP